MSYIVKLEDLPPKLDSLEPILDKIVEGDCLDLMRRMSAGCVDVVITDPPYGVNLGSHRGAKETRPGLLIKRGGYNDTEENFNKTVIPAIKTALSLCSRAMVFCVPPSMWKLPAPDVIGGIFLAAAVGLNRWGWSNMIHCLLYGKAPGLHNGAKPTGISNNASAEVTGHPTTKPLRWLKWAVALGSQENETIFDPFLGSGTTAVAAKKLGRHFIGCEINPDYCKIAEKRLLGLDAQPELFKPERAAAAQRPLLAAIPHKGRK